MCKAVYERLGCVKLGVWRPEGVEGWECGKLCERLGVGGSGVESWARKAVWEELWCNGVPGAHLFLAVSMTEFMILTYL